MKKLLARLPVIIIGIPAVYWLLVRADNYLKLLFLAIIAILGQYELCSMLEKGNRKPILEWISSVIIISGAFWGEFVNATDDALALFGRPLCKYRRLVSADVLDALTGFICCDKPVIAAPSGAYLSEVAEIENYLTTGLYLE